jgi:hypothetical protein
MKRTMKASLTTFLLLASAPAWAQTSEPEVEMFGDDLYGLAFSFDVYGLRRLDVGYDRWRTGKDWTAVGLELGYDLFRLSGSTQLALTFGWVAEEQEPRPSQSRSGVPWTEHPPIMGELQTNSLHIGAVLRWRTDQALQPYAGVAVGGTRGELLLDPWSSSTLKARAHGLFGRASLGLRLQPRVLTVKKSGGAPLFGLALGLEVGAMAGTPLALKAEPSAAPQVPEERIPVEPVPLGSLAPGGGYGRLALMVVF